MRYRLRQKLLALGDDYTIQDADGHDVYFVDGRAFSIGNKLSLQDMQGNELAFISQKLLSLKKTYRIHRNGELFAEIKKQWSWLRDTLTVDVPGPNDYTVKGDFIDRNYTFERGGRTVAQVSRAFFSLRDSYGVDIVPGEDDITILATAIVIDQILEDQEDD